MCDALIFTAEAVYGLMFIPHIDSEHFNPQAILVTTAQKLTNTSCARISLFYSTGISFHVRAPLCIKSVDYYGQLLEIVDQSLGPVWHNVWLPMIVTENCDVQLQFEAIYDSDYPKEVLTTAIDSITVLNGGCLGL